MVDPKSVVFFHPNGLSRFKDDLFNRVGSSIKRAGGRVIRGNVEELAKISDDELPTTGCMPETRELLDEWITRKRDFCYWDRGYVRRIFATWLPRGENGGFYRWTRNGFQMSAIRNVPDDRWKSLNIKIEPWRKNGKHILICAPTRTYARFHHTEDWIANVIDALARVTDRQLMIRDKESKRPLQMDLDGAHCCVTHGSIAAVEAAILGTPIFVDKSSAASLIGHTDLRKIETPIYSDREPWCHNLAYNQFSEPELVDGTLWRLMQ